MKKCQGAEWCLSLSRGPSQSLQSPLPFKLGFEFVGLIFLMQESVEAIHVSFARGKAGKGKDSKGDRGDKGDGRGDRKGDRKGDGKGKDP